MPPFRPHTLLGGHSGRPALPRGPAVLLGPFAEPTLTPAPRPQGGKCP